MQEVAVLNRSVYCLTLCLYVGRPEETKKGVSAVAVNKGCHDVGLKRQQL